MKLRSAHAVPAAGRLRYGLHQSADHGIPSQALIDLEAAGLGIAVFPRPGRLADLTEVTTQCLLWPEPEASARVRLANALDKINSRAPCAVNS